MLSTNNYGESDARFPAVACMCTCLHTFTHSHLLFFCPSYSFTSAVIIMKHMVQSVRLSPADGVGGKGFKGQCYTLLPQESRRTVLP